MRSQLVIYVRCLAGSNWLRCLWLLIVVMLVGASYLFAEAESVAIRHFRTIYPSEWGVPHPTGLAYAREQGQLFLLDQSNALPDRTNTTLVSITPYEDLVNTVSLAFPLDDAINITFDDRGQRLFLLNNQRAELAQVQVDHRGNLDPTTLLRLDVAALGLRNVQGLAVDVAQRRLLMLDSGAHQVVSVALDASGINPAVVSRIDLAALGITGLRGLAVHPVTHHLYLVSQATQQLYALTASGKLVAAYGLADLALIGSDALLFAPSADLTDPPATFHLFIADSALAVGRRQADAQPYGFIMELFLGCGECTAPSQWLTVSTMQSHDDAEEQLAGGRMITDSSDLELVQEATTQTIGLRFPGVMIPPHAIIVTATIVLTTDELDDKPTTLFFYGEATADAAPFTALDGDLSRRTLTAATVTWSDLPAWSVASEKHQTPDLAPIVQELIDQADWRSGNALAFLITGNGKRTAVAYDGDPVYAPQLIINYTDPLAIPTPTPPPVLSTAPVRFAVIGDYGKNNTNEARVATLVSGWNPDFVITTGDNNYPEGEAATIDDNVGQYYSQFIGNYQGVYGPGSLTNRFWPSLGNHDWHTITCTGSSCTGAYFDYFTLPHHERYYDVDLGLVHLFAIDSDNSEPDGREQTSIQAAWLQQQLAASAACYNLVYFHHPPYSSGRHGSNEAMQWPFAAWGADAVFSAHEHLYERLDVGGMPYFVNGAGGATLYTFDNVGNLPPEVHSIVRYNQDHGAMLVTATTTGITYQFYTADGLLIDEYPVATDCAVTIPTPMVTPTPTLTVTATIPAPPTATPSNPETPTPIATAVPTPVPTVDSHRVIHVPGDAATIQAAIDLAADGDVVLVAPGIYYENLQIAEKTITLASHFYTTGDAGLIEGTIIDGRDNTVITVAPSVGPETKIIGFTIQNGSDGISPAAKLHILNNRFIGNSDAIDYEGGGGICRNNLFEDNSDDAIDLDGTVEVTIEDNLIRNNGDDGIEIRLHAYTGPLLNIIIRGNVIVGNEADGIQLIDYGTLSDRFFLIEQNVIKANAMAGLGLMDNRETTEDFRGASIQERIHLFHNTFINNDHALTGGDNLIALNNIFVGSPNIALKNVDGNSIAAHNLFWGNGIDQQNANIDPVHTIVADPRFDEQDRLQPGSPAIDAGIALFTWNAEIVLDLQASDYSGVAPDLGRYETQATANSSTNRFPVMTEQLFLPVVFD
ncbi:MAG: metallophosphoesterase [Caldilineaceae bacterium]